MSEVPIVIFVKNSRFGTAVMQYSTTNKLILLPIGAIKVSENLDKELVECRINEDPTTVNLTGIPQQ